MNIRVKAHTKRQKDRAVRKYLDSSTAHITEKDMRLLDHEGRPRLEHGVISVPHHYGAWVHVPDGPTDWADQARRGGFSKDFIALVRFARKKGCLWINLDSDGETIDGLHENSW